MNILSLIPTAIIAFLPILVWGYIFSYLDNSPLNARRFGIGILAGAFSVVPVLYLQDILSYAGFDTLNIFTRIVGASALDIGLSFALMIVTIASVIWIASIATFFSTATAGTRLFVKNMCIILVIGVLYTLFHSILLSLPIFDTPLSGGGVTIGKAVFNTLRLVLLYYIVIGVIEESSKHFSMVGSSGDSVESVQK